MLVTFKSTATGDITMFGDVATTLLKMMGQSGEVPGAILGDEIAAALDALAANLRQLSVTSELSNNGPADSKPDDGEPDNGEPDNDEPDNDETGVSLATRANPLIKLLEEAAASNADVIWEM